MRKRLLFATRGVAVIAIAGGTVAAKAAFGEERAAVLRPAPTTQLRVAPVTITTPPPTYDVSATPVVSNTSQVVAAAATSTTTTTLLGRRTVSGDIADTEYGPLQVELVMEGARIVDVRTPIYPQSSDRSREINDPALPMLRARVLEAQSSDIQGISGATVTYEAYKLSVQSALDNA